MTETIKIWMHKDDAAIVRKIFDRSPTPTFTIVGEQVLDVEGGSDFVHLELFAEDTLSIWHLAKEVQMEQDFDRRMKEIIENTRKKIDENFEARKEELLKKHYGKDKLG